MQHTLNHRYIPTGSRAIEGLGGVVYSYEGNGKPMAVAYRGKANKAAWHFSFKSEARREQAIQDFFDGITAHVKFKQEQKIARNKPNQLQVGDIIENSWGYEQTNVDFYEVVKTSEAFVWLQAVNSQEVKQTGYMTGLVVAVPGTGHGEISKHKVSYGNSAHFKHGSGGKWDGTPQRYSSYA